MLPALAPAPAEADPPAVAEEPDGEADPPLSFDTPGRSQPASTGNPIPTRAERAIKDRRDGTGGTRRERENAEVTGTP